MLLKYEMEAGPDWSTALVHLRNTNEGIFDEIHVHKSILVAS